jgi:hypothetical protein
MNDTDWLNKVALAASVYCEKPDVNEDEIDRFIEFLFRVYGYEKLMKIRGVK